MSVREFAKRNWLGILAIVGVFIGITSPLLTIYFYKRTIAPPEPVFLIDPSRTVIVDSDRFFEAPLRIIRSNGDEIKGDVTSVRFYFWNDGRKSIKNSNILEPLVVTLDDPNGEILDYKILKCSRRVVNPLVERNSTEPNKSLDLSFSILEQNDGLTCQVIYGGNPEASLEIDGTIEGSRISTGATIKRRWHKEFIKNIALVILVVGIFAVFAYGESRTPKIKPTKPKPTKWSEIRLGARIFLIIFSGGVIIVMLFGLKNAIKTAQERTLTSVIEEIPKDIIP